MVISGPEAIVIKFPFRFIGESFIGDTDLLELLCYFRLVRVFVRMILFCQLPIGLFDLILGGIKRNI